MATKILRGNRFRKARRFLKRNPEKYLVAAFPGTDGKIAALIYGPPEMGAPIDNPGVPVETTIEIVTDLCPVCDASGDDPCVTKTGNKAKQRHAGRDTL